MGEIRLHQPTLLIAAVSSKYESAIDVWTREAGEAAWGNVVLESPIFDFTETNFYAPTMGTDLKKKLFAFENLLDPANIANTKILSNQMETNFIAQHEYPEERPLNIDPGYVTEAKLVLATTKDRDHRLYLRDGIFAEVTLHYTQGVWVKSRWTYPDYQRADFHSFFTQCRDLLRQQIRR